MFALIPALLVAIGAGIATAALSRTRQLVSQEPSAVELALGKAALPDGPAQRPGFLYRAAEPAIRTSAAVVRRLSPATPVDLIRRRILYAGMDGRLKVERVLAYKAGWFVAGFLLGAMASPGQVPAPVWGLLVGGIASFVPEFRLDSRARSRQAGIARDLPEAIDLLALTVEAGLGLDQALEVVVDNLDGPLNEELTRLLREIGLGVSRRDALKGLRERTDVPDLSGFVVALIQAGEMGTSIAQVLRVQAEQVRLRRRQHAREKASQTPVKILFPLVLGIFPAIFVVTVGPGALSIMENLFH